MAVYRITKPMYPYRCDMCLAQVFAYGDDDPKLGKFIDHHANCEGPKTEARNLLPAKESTKEVRRWRWGTQEWSNRRCALLHKQGIITETYCDESRPRGVRYGYRRAKV